MATLASNVLTLQDWAKLVDPDGKIATIVELLSQTNGILKDMLFKMGNLETGHVTTVRTGLPDVFWRLLNQGVQPSKSTSTQITEGCGMLEAYSEVDIELAELSGDVNGFRLAEAQAFVEAMNQEMASTVFYGNSSTAPEEFNGLAIRYSSLSAANGQNIINAGGAGSDNSSIYLCAFGEKSFHGIFPKNSKAGLVHEDLGKQLIQTSAGVAGNRMMAYVDHWKWKVGLALKDWRYVVRIANIDISNLVAKSSAADLCELMIKATHRIPNKDGVKLVFYMNRSVFQMLDIQRRDDVINGGGLNYQNVDGEVRPTFRGIPVVVCDALLESEAAVA